MEVIETFVEEIDRYAFDFGRCSLAKGWAQVDTEQDFAHFGIWAHPTKLQIVTYAEGDVTIHKAATPDEFCAELRRVAEWNVQMGFRPVFLDPGVGAAAKEPWKALGLTDLLHCPFAYDRVVG